MPTHVFHPHQRSPHAHVFAVVTGVVSGVIVIGGWLWGVRTTVTQGLTGARETFAQTSSALSEVRGAAEVPAKQGIDAAGEALRGTIAPYVVAAEQQRQALGVVAAMVKGELETPTTEDAPVNTTEPEPDLYGQVQ